MSQGLKSYKHKYINNRIDRYHTSNKHYFVKKMYYYYSIVPHISGYANFYEGEYIAENSNTYMKDEKSLLEPKFIGLLEYKRKYGVVLQRVEKNRSEEIMLPSKVKDVTKMYLSGLHQEKVKL